MSGQSYIITFTDDATPAEIQAYIDEINQNGGQVTYEYDIIKAIAAVVPDALLPALWASNITQSIEPDQIITLDPVPEPTAAIRF